MFAVVRWPSETSLSVYETSGSVKFYQENSDTPVTVSVNLEGLPDGVHGFHVHEKALEDFSGDVMECCDKLGGHFNVGPRWSLENTSGTKHGSEGHNGDLCNNIFVNYGRCEFYFTDDKISLYPWDEKSIIGRSLVIHAGRDDLGRPYYNDPQKDVDKYITGNAGKRIACGNIIKVTDF